MIVIEIALHGDRYRTSRGSERDKGASCEIDIGNTRTLKSVESLSHSLPLAVLYRDEFQFRFNNPHNPYLFRDTLLRLLASSNLEYKELTRKEAA